LISRKVELKIPPVNLTKCLMRIFESDFDTIFNNLITNSLTAFTRKDATNERFINISILIEEQKLIINYEDSGPGLAEEIENPKVILEPFFTTKRNPKGIEIGTGLGLWLVKSIMEYYKGSIVISPKRPGFKIILIFPIKNDEGIVYEV